MTTQTELKRLKAAAYAAWAAERKAYAVYAAAWEAALKADAARMAARAAGYAADAAWEAAYVRSTHKRLSRKKVQS